MSTCVKFLIISWKFHFNVIKNYFSSNSSRVKATREKEREMKIALTVIIISWHKNLLSAFVEYSNSIISLLFLILQIRFSQTFLCEREILGNFIANWMESLGGDLLKIYENFCIFPRAQSAETLQNFHGSSPKIIFVVDFYRENIFSTSPAYFWIVVFFTTRVSIFWSIQNDGNYLHLICLILQWLIHSNFHEIVKVTTKEFLHFPLSKRKVGNVEIWRLK